MSIQGAGTQHSPRRRRYDRPWSLWVFGLALLVSPIANYIAIARYYGLSVTAVGEVFSHLSFISKLLITLPVPLAIGILLVRRWAWWLFLVYAPLLVLHNLYAIYVNPSSFNTQALGGALFGTSLMIYFLRRDVFAPFLHTGKRGWRRASRKALTIDVHVSGVTLKSRDVSLSGVFVEWPDCPHTVNTGVTVVLQFPSGPLELNAGIVHVSAHGAGLAFRAMNKEAKQKLQHALDNAER